MKQPEYEKTTTIYMTKGACCVTVEVYFGMDEEYIYIKVVEINKKKMMRKVNCKRFHTNTMSYIRMREMFKHILADTLYTAVFDEDFFRSEIPISEKIFTEERR